MNGNTLLGIVIGVVAGAFLVDTFQPAQDLLDNCKHEFKAKMKPIQHATKTAAKSATKAVGDKVETVKQELIKKD
ncbi:MAG: hypothetical protein FWD76_02805 [Firmicutes bacterium]|nr:hypothetical protein [Bacillota bacterium]